MSVKINIDKGSLNMTMKSLDKKAKQINAAASEGLESVAEIVVWLADRRSGGGSE